MNPIHREQMREQHARLKQMPFIPVILAHTCKRLLLSYYGGYRRMIWRIVADSCWAWWQTSYWRFVMWISDTIGWTHVVKNIRHGAKCDGVRCFEDAAKDCLRPSIPKWFQRISGMERE